MKINWTQKFEELLKKYHKKNIKKLAKKLNSKCSLVYSSMKIRSKKYKVPCTITLDNIKNKLLNSYGTYCKYFPDRQLTYKNIVFDHIVPISKDGESSDKNIQIISNYANRIKSSLSETNLDILLKWLQTIPEDLKRDILFRLSHGYIKG